MLWGLIPRELTSQFASFIPYFGEEELDDAVSDDC